MSENSLHNNFVAVNSAIFFVIFVVQLIINFLADNVTYICLYGVLCFCYYFFLLGKLNERERDLSKKSPYLNKIRLIILSIVSFTNFQLHLITVSVMNINTSFFNWVWVIPSLIPFGLGAIANFKNSTTTQRGLVGRASTSSVNIDIATNFYTVFSGLWGATAFHHAKYVLSVQNFISVDFTNLSYENPFTPFSSYFYAAYIIYKTQGQFWFYLVWGIVPLIFLFCNSRRMMINAFSIEEHGEQETTKLAKGFIMSVVLILIAWLIGNQTLDFQFIKTKFLPFSGTVESRWFDIDKDLSNCTLKFVNHSEIKAINCYQQSLTRWDAELKNIEEQILMRSNDNKTRVAAFVKEDKKWNDSQYRYFKNLERKLLKRKDKALILVKEKIENKKQYLKIIVSKAKNYNYRLQ
jgi:hypothetical protein